MDDGNGKAKNRREQIQAIIDQDDLAPDQRAAFVIQEIREKIPDLKEWDLVCFSAEFLGYMSAMYPWLLEHSKEICKLVYAAHYLEMNDERESGILTKLRNPSESDGNKRNNDETEIVGHYE